MVPVPDGDKVGTETEPTGVEMVLGLSVVVLDDVTVLVGAVTLGVAVLVMTTSGTEAEVVVVVVVDVLVDVEVVVTLLILLVLV